MGNQNLNQNQNNNINNNVNNNQNANVNVSSIPENHPLFPLTKNPQFHFIKLQVQKDPRNVESFLRNLKENNANLFAVIAQ